VSKRFDDAGTFGQGFHLGHEVRKLVFSFGLFSVPHWKFAPFIGAGGTYNYSLSSISGSTIMSSTSSIDVSNLSNKSDSHVESGFRLWMNNRVRLLEILGRYKWGSLGTEHDYWLVGISTGVGI